MPTARKEKRISRGRRARGGKMEEQLTRDETRWLLSSLKKVSFFSSVTVDTIDIVISKFFKKSLKKGKVIIKKGDIGEAFYIIKSGKCLVYRKIFLFFREKIAVLAEGDFFGEMSLVFDDETSASVKALVDTEIFVLLKSSFTNIVQGNPELTREIKYIAEKRQYEISKKI